MHCSALPSVLVALRLPPARPSHRRRPQQLACAASSAPEASVRPPGQAAGGSDLMVASCGGGGGGSGRRRRTSFEERCQQLEEFSKEHGHTLVPTSEPSGGSSSQISLDASGLRGACLHGAAAGGWVQAHRPAPFSWSGRGPRQLAGGHPCSALRQIPACSVCLPLFPAGLGTWVAQARQAWKAGRLAPARQQRLAALGLSGDAFQEAWAARFSQLAAFHSQHSHCRVTRAHPALHSWLSHQQHQWRQGTLGDERRRRLEGLGVQFSAHGACWEARFQELLQYRQVGGWGRLARRGGRPACCPALPPGVPPGQHASSSAHPRPPPITAPAPLRLLIPAPLAAPLPACPSCLQEFDHADVPARWPPNQALAYWVAVQRRRWLGVHGAALTPLQQSRLLGCG
jgi:hypothetical protein